MPKESYVYYCFFRNWYYLFSEPWTEAGFELVTGELDKDIPLYDCTKLNLVDFSKEDPDSGEVYLDLHSMHEEEVYLVKR